MGTRETTARMLDTKDKDDPTQTEEEIKTKYTQGEEVMGHMQYSRAEVVKQENKKNW